MSSVDSLLDALEEALEDAEIEVCLESALAKFLVRVRAAAPSLVRSQIAVEVQSKQ